MPLVTTKTVHIGKGTFQLRINVDSTGLFWATLPPPLQLTLGKEKIEGFKSIDELDRAYDQAYKAHVDASTVVTRVILYKVKLAGSVMDEEDRKCIFSASDISFADGLGIVFDAGVFDEERTEMGGSVRYFYRYVKDAPFRPESSRELTSGGKAANQLPYTEENIAFFLKLLKGMQQLLLEMDKLRKGPENVQALIQSGQFMLGRPSQKALTS